MICKYVCAFACVEFIDFFMYLYMSHAQTMSTVSVHVCLG